MKEINGEKCLWYNYYTKYAITSRDCKICGADLVIYWIENQPVPVASFCNTDLVEMLPAMSAFVEEQLRIDNEYQAI